MSTIEEASTYLETFISERDNTKVLEDCVNSLQQIRGSLDIIQLHGACELAGEILNSASQIVAQNTTQLDKKLAALTKGFFVLTCYFEYTQQHEVGMPILLVPYINDIRLINNQTLMPESYFETIDTSYRSVSANTAVNVSPEETKVIIRRFRHMYQQGLLGLIKNDRTQQSLKLLNYVVAKVYKLSQGSNSETLWWLASYSINAFIEAGIELTATRRRSFVQLDKLLKTLEATATESFSVAPSEELIKEFAFYIAISGLETPQYEQIKTRLKLKTIPYTDTILMQEAVSLTGPSANTVQSVAAVLRVELNICKENIESLQPSEEGTDGQYKDTIERIQNIKDILDVVGLTSPAKVLNESLTHLQSAHQQQNAMSDDDNTIMADAFLYIESVLNSLESNNFSGDKLEELNKLTQVEMVSNNHLLNAQSVVIEQVQHGLVAIKTTLTAFSDSGFDKRHLDEISDRLGEVRGGMTVLSLPRAASIVGACSDFINETLKSTHETAALSPMLETFADALICLEYYLDCMTVDKNISTNTLVIAEESLAILGYNV